MPKWTTHTEGGSWYGGGTKVPDCSESRRNAITSAYNNFINKSCLNCFPGLRDCLKEKWGSIEIDCTDSDCDGSLSGRRSGNKILLCCNTISCTTSSNRLGPVLLHELVHACGGTELDAEAAEHKCFNGNGATLPSSSDWDKFKDDKGKYVIWDSDTGEVWGKSNGGKGDLCFQHDGWKHTFPDDGGWI